MLVDDGVIVVGIAAAAACKQIENRQTERNLILLQYDARHIPNEFKPSMKHEHTHCTYTQT